MQFISRVPVIESQNSRPDVTDQFNVTNWSDSAVHNTNEENATWADQIRATTTDTTTTTTTATTTTATTAIAAATIGELTTAGVDGARGGGLDNIPRRGSSTTGGETASGGNGLKSGDPRRGASTT